MNLGYATFFIRIIVVCGECSASKLRSKQHPVKISSSKKIRQIRSETSGTAVDALNNGPSIEHVFELDDEESFPKLRKPTTIRRAWSRDESTMTDISIRERRTSRRRVERGGAKTDGSAETTHSVVHGCRTTRVDTCRVKKCSRGSTRDLMNPGQPTTYMPCVAHNLVTVSNSSSRT